MHRKYDGFILDRILDINNARLKSWKLAAISITEKCTTRADDALDDGDKIPM